MANELGNCLQDCWKIEPRTTIAHFVGNQRSPVSRNCCRHSVRPLSSNHSPTTTRYYHDSIVCCAVQYYSLSHFLYHFPSVICIGLHHVNHESCVSSISLFLN